MKNSHPTPSKGGPRIILVTVSDITQPLGEAVSALSVASSLAKDFGYKTLVVAPRTKNADPIFQTDGVTIKWTFNLTKLGLPNSLNVFPQLFTLGCFLLRKDATHVYIRYNPCALFTTLISRIARRGCVIVEHNAWLEDERRGGDRFSVLYPLERCLQSATAKLASINRTVIQDNADKLIANGVQKDAVIVAPNATNTHIIQPYPKQDALARFNLSDRFRYIGFIGTFAYWQDVPILIEAMPKILDNMGNVRLILAGHGPEKRKAEIKACELGVQDKVISIGRVPYLEIPKLMGCLDLALLPTRANFYITAGRSPMKLYDYAAAGKPILAAEIKGLSSYVKGGWMLTYKPGDCSDLAEKTVMLLQDNIRLEELGLAARKTAETHFSWRKRLKPIVDVISMYDGSNRNTPD